MKFSKRANRLIGQGMFQVKTKAENLERTGKKLLHFEIGDTCFDSPNRVKKACIRAIKENKTHYTDPLGLRELRDAIAKRYGVNINNVAICPANFGIFAILSVLCNPKDKIDYPIPGFPTYKAVAKYLNLKRSNNAKIKIITSPNNPDGKIKYGDFGKDQFIILDMAYNKIYFDKEQTIRCNLKKSTIICSFSKTHSMPGFRLGFILAEPELINKIGLLIETTYSCLPEFIQRAGLEALKVEDYKLHNLRFRRHLMYLILKEHYEVELPEGGIYFWCKCKDGDKEAERLLKKGIVVCPGSVFGKRGYIRFCFAKPIKDIRELNKKL